MKVALPAHMRRHLEGRLPTVMAAVWYKSSEAAAEVVADAEVAWLDFVDRAQLRRVVESAGGLKWVTTVIAGIGGYPLDIFQARGIAFTNGAGVNTNPVSEYAVMGVLALAKNMPAILDIQASKVWPHNAPGRVELLGSKALVIGYGAIGQAIAKGLRGLGVDVVGVRRSRSDDPDVIGVDDWRARLPEFDWVVLAAPATHDTRKLIGRDELRRMKPTAYLVNIARGTLVDQPALLEAVNQKRLAGAFLDVTDPEPAPPDDPVWATPGVIMTCHMSGRAQSHMTQRAAAAFLENLDRYRTGRPLNNLVDLAAGY